MDFANVLGCKFWVIGLYLGQGGKSGVHFASISLAGRYILELFFKNQWVMLVC
jgi:hypothetical protein